MIEFVATPWLANEHQINARNYFELAGVRRLKVFLSEVGTGSREENASKKLRASV